MLCWAIEKNEKYRARLNFWRVSGECSSGYFSTPMKNDNVRSQIHHSSLCQKAVLRDVGLLKMSLCSVVSILIIHHLIANVWVWACAKWEGNRCDSCGGILLTPHMSWHVPRFLTTSQISLLITCMLSYFMYCPQHKWMECRQMLFKRKSEVEILLFLTMKATPFFAAFNFFRWMMRFTKKLKE